MTAATWNDKSPSLPAPIVEGSARPAEAPERLSAIMQAATLAAVVVPFMGVVAAAYFLWGWGFRWLDLGLLIGMYLLSAIGITVGFPRLFTHRAFQTNAVVKFVLAALAWDIELPASRPGRGESAVAAECPTPCKK